MSDSLSSMLVEQIDLLLEGYNLDNNGNLVEVNKKKVMEADKLFHEYFIRAMGGIYRKINEESEMDLFDSEDETHDGEGDAGVGSEIDESDESEGDAGVGEDNSEMSDHMDESMYDWMQESVDLDIDSFFNLTEGDDDEHSDEHMEDECDDNMMETDFNGIPDDESEDGDLDTDDLNMDAVDHDNQDEHSGYGDGAGIELNRNEDHPDDFDLDTALDHEHDDSDELDTPDEDGGEDMFNDNDDDMITVRGTTENGGDFSFSFDPDTLGFEGEDDHHEEGDMDEPEEDHDMENMGEPEEGEDHDMEDHDMENMDDENDDLTMHDMEDSPKEFDDEPVRESKAPRGKKAVKPSNKIDIVPTNTKSKKARPMG